MTIVRHVEEFLHEAHKLGGVCSIYFTRSWLNQAYLFIVCMNAPASDGRLTLKYTYIVWKLEYTSLYKQKFKI